MAGAHKSDAALRKAVERASRHLAESDFRRVLKDVKPFLSGGSVPVPVSYFAGMAHHGLGRTARAHGYLRDVAARDPDSEAGLFAAATVAMDEDRIDAARATLARLLKQQPGNPHALNSAALCEKAHGDLRAALELWQRALKVAPGAREIRINYVETVLMAGFGEAAAQALAELPDAEVARDPKLSALAAEADLVRGDLDSARERLERGAQHWPAGSVATQELVTVYSILGESQRAAELADRAVRANPALTTCALTLYELADFLPDPEAARRRALDTAPTRYGNLDPLRTEPAELLGLGELFEHRGEIANAADCYRRGNAQLAARLDSFGYRYARDAVDSYAEAVETRGPAILGQIPDAGASDAAALPDAVFIVGLPRSGTSLIERILDAHPQAQGVGESPALSNLAQELGFGPVDRPAVEGLDRLARLTAAERADLRRRYFEAVGVAEGTHIVVDKNMYNSVFAPLIAGLFARPAILHVRRDYADNAVSILSKHFMSPYPFTCDLAALQHYAAASARIVAATAAARPGIVAPFVYESLTENPRAATERLLAAVGLPWAEDCLAYHRRKATVATASRDQVRRPISAASVGRGTKFRPYLDGLDAPDAPAAPAGRNRAESGD